MVHISFDSSNISQRSVERSTAAIPHRIICKILAALAVGVSATQKVESERKEIEETKERAGKYEGKDAARVGFT